MLKIGVFGSSVDTMDDNESIASILGAEIAKTGNAIVTGACKGLPYFAVQGAKKNGGYSIGYSASVRKSNHEKEMGTSLKMFDELRLIPVDYKYAKDIKICRKYRNVMSVADCDIALFVGGRWGTLNEFSIAYDAGKLMGVLSNSSKFSGHVPELIESFQKASDGKVIYETDPIKLVNKVVEFYLSDNSVNKNKIKEEISSSTYEEYKIIDQIYDIPFHTSNNLKLFMGAIKTQHKDRIVEHALIYSGNIKKPNEPILLRINSACYTGDIFDCQRCDCHWQLNQSMKLISKKQGLIIYHLHHEGRGSGLANKLKTYKVMDEEKKTTFDACSRLHLQPDQRRYFSSILILKELGITDVNLITNNTYKVDILKENGIRVHERIPLVSRKKELRKYLLSKRDQYGHLIKFKDSKKGKK